MILFAEAQRTTASGRSRCRELAITGPANLREVQKVCLYLQQVNGSGSETKLLLGYLECPKFFRHEIYRSSPPERGLAVSRSANFTSLRNALGTSNGRSMGIYSRLRLAHKLSVAVLYYSFTAWLTQNWDISDFSILGSYVDGTSLGTLHLNAKIGGKLSQAPRPMSELGKSKPQGKQAVEPPAKPSAEFLFGIKNMILYNLAVALLEIALAAPLSSFRQDSDQHLVHTARRLVLEEVDIDFGPSYLNIIRKCLECEFESKCGNDLAATDLRCVFYNEVVSVLEGIIERLRG